MSIRYLAVATDYDGTIALHGRVDEPTIEALEKCRLSGRRLLLVTGRELEELQEIFPRLDLFDLVVAENGALLYNPSDKKMTLLGDPPPEPFVASLHERGVAPMSVGHIIVATWRPHEVAVLEAIRDNGLEMQVIFNKDAVMVLPSGINKASGLQAALKELSLSPHNCVGVGDAENDHAFLTLCECSVAVENALDSLKEKADLVTKADHGAGVAEMIEALLENDLRELDPNLERHSLLLGTNDAGEVRVRAQGESLLVCGSSGSGKSTLTAALIERLGEQQYQYCIVDPEGDYQNLPDAVLLGDPGRVPSIEEILNVLKDPSQNVVVNLLGVALDHRPEFFEELLPQLVDMRSRQGHPHWIILDEAHHLLPASWNRNPSVLDQGLHGFMLITVHPEHVPAPLLGSIDTFLVTGKAPAESLAAFGEAVGKTAPSGIEGDLNTGEYILWRWRDGAEVVRFQIAPSSAERTRHHRKYAQGEMDPERSFYFRGPEKKLNLRAQNLILFNQLAEGVDDETWLFHLREGDYSRWFSEGVKDEELAVEAAAVEEDQALTADESRKRIRELIEKRYTLPADKK